MLRILATLLGLAAAAAAVGALIVRYVPITGHSVLLIASASPYLMLMAPIAAVLLLAGRRRVLAVLAAILTALLVTIQLPLYVGAKADTQPSITVRVMTANLGLGQADPIELTASAQQFADVLVVQEITEDAAKGLSAAGIDRGFPHRVLDPRPVAAGVGIWSRYPINEADAIDGYSLPMLRARLHVPGAALAPTIVAIHIAAPWPQPIDGWRRDLDRYPALLRSLAADRGAVIVAGDFNATLDMRPFRELLAAGYRDAGEQAGAGLARTFPNRDGRPAVLGIDHILLNDCVSTEAHTVAVDGSDHRAVIATVDLPS